MHLFNTSGFRVNGVHYDPLFKIEDRLQRETPERAENAAAAQEERQRKAEEARRAPLEAGAHR